MEIPEPNHYLHQRGSEVIAKYEGTFMRTQQGIVEIVATRYFVKKDDPEAFVAKFDEVIAQIALGPGESVKLDNSVPSV